MGNSEIRRHKSTLWRRADADGTAASDLGAQCAVTEGTPVSLNMLPLHLRTWPTQVTSTETKPYR